MRKRKDGGLSLTTITKMLENVKTPKSFTQLRMSSTPREHRGFIKYLNYCKKQNFIQWSDEVALSGRNIVEYRLASNGWKFLELNQ